MACAAAVTAQFVGGKATRDALFLTSLDFTALPAMLIATSVCSILLVAAHTRWAASIAPAKARAGWHSSSSGLLFICEWLIRASAPSSTAISSTCTSPAPDRCSRPASGSSPPNGSTRAPRNAVSDRLPAPAPSAACSARLLSAHVATWGVPSMLLVLAALQFVSAWLVRRLAVRLEPSTTPLPDDATADAPGRAVGPARRRRIAAPASSRRARAARNDERCAGRVSLQGQGVRNARPRRPSPAFFLALLCRNQLRHAAPPDCC